MVDGRQCADEMSKQWKMEKVLIWGDETTHVQAFTCRVIHKDGGGWRMWYKDERQDSFTCYADSPDLYEWEYRGRAAEDQAEEGPNVFSFGGTCWMIADVWDGLAVYRSDDCEHFVRQKENILRESGTRRDDQGRGAHADVFVTGGRAFVVYFTHPENTPRSAVQMAELKIEDGKLICDRNAEFDADWRAE